MPAASPLVRLLVSAGAAVGGGHLSRGITLAVALQERGRRSVRVQLVVLRGAPTDRQLATVTDLGVDVVLGGGHGAGDDAAVTVVDLPDPNEELQIGGRGRLVVFDDREVFVGRAEIVVQPSLPTWSGSGSADRVLAGYAYAPIRSSLRRLAADDDPADVSWRLAPALGGLGPWTTTTVVGPRYGGTLLERPPGTVEVVRDPDDLDVRLARAALVVGGAGTMKFELAVLGRPMLLVAVADDQLPVGPEFAATGAAQFLGDGRTLDAAAVAASVVELMADAAGRQAMGERGRAVVDGRGGDRIADAILELIASAGE